ncbi:MAG: hypothetical protein TUN42_07650 [Dehalogenimonas sp.]
MFKKGDHLSIAFRTDKKVGAEYILGTLKDCEVIDQNGSILRVKAIDQKESCDGNRSNIFMFDISSPKYVGAIPT